MKIDPSGWKEFRFGSLVDTIYKAVPYDSEMLEYQTYWTMGSVPYVTRTESDNSVKAMVLADDDVNLEEGNAITIGDTTSTIAYQPHPFITGEHIIVIRAKWLNSSTGLFITALLRRERYRYSYGRAYKMNLIRDTKLRLPVTHNGSPDWQWMEDYIASLHSKPLTTKNISGNIPIDMSTWKEFTVSDLFMIINGKGITSEEIEDNPGDFEAVQSGEGNNGVMGLIDRSYCREMGYSCCEEPCLTVARSGTSGFVSFHKKGCVVGDSAKILLLKDQNARSSYVYLFIQTLLKANRFKYTYGRKVTETLYGKTIIKLPVVEDGNPDWQLMEDYIKSLPYGDRL